MLGAEVATHMRTSTVSDWLEGVSGVWTDSDVLIGNLECPCVSDAKPMEGTSPKVILHASVERLQELATAGFSAVTLANNHIMDCGPLGLAETIRGLDRSGIYHAGAGMNLSEAIQPAFIPVGNLVIGLVAFCYGPRADRRTPGAAPYEPKIMHEALSRARAGADIVIAALHDGLEYSDVPPSQTRKRYRFLAENGADIVIGHHPHVLQGLEWYNGVPIAYSLGDLIFDNSLPEVTKSNFSTMAMSVYAPNEIERDAGKFSRGALLTVHISEGQKLAEWHPFRQDSNLRPQLSFGKVKTEDLQRLENLSAALLNTNDDRHLLADSVFQAAWWEARKSLRMSQLLKLALKPKWRYLPHGVRWLYQRVKFG